MTRKSTLLVLLTFFLAACNSPLPRGEGPAGEGKFFPASNPNHSCHPSPRHPYPDGPPANLPPAGNAH